MWTWGVVPRRGRSGQPVAGWASPSGALAVQTQVDGHTPRGWGAGSSRCPDPGGGAQLPEGPPPVLRVLLAVRPGPLGHARGPRASQGSPTPSSRGRGGAGRRGCGAHTSPRGTTASGGSLSATTCTRRQRGHTVQWLGRGGGGEARDGSVMPPCWERGPQQRQRDPHGHAGPFLTPRPQPHASTAS